MKIAHNSSQFLLIVAWLFLLLAACGGERMLPTVVPEATAPLLPTATPGSPSSRANSAGSIADAGAGAAIAAVSELPLTPFPQVAGRGIPPAEARQQFVPDAGPETVGERPPPYDVPLALHPDDHYWLMRPIPSGSRNYDLEWYPYGGDVQLPELDPYRIHHGVDFPNETGTPIVAASSGTVIYAGVLPSPRNGVNYYGNTVLIQHDWQWQGKDVFTLYAHTLELFVQAGDRVDQGQLIAGVGSSGEVSGAHLHLEVRVGTNNYGSTRNPVLWLVPFEGYGTLVGRFVDRNGRFIPDARLTLRALDGSILPRTQQTYNSSVASDEVWQENFAVGDLPAGDYLLNITYAGITYERKVTIRPGQTSTVAIGTLTEYRPPPPTPTPLSPVEEAPPE